MLKAMLVASAVLPMPGRPARMTRSERCRPPIVAVEIAQARGDARQAAVALVGGRRHVDGGGERVGEALEAAVVFALLGELVEAALGFLDLVARRGLDRRVVGDVDHVLADADQAAPDGEVVDGAAVILGVDDGGRLGREAGQILRDGDAAEIVVAEKRLQGDRRRHLAGLDEAGRHLVDAPVQLLEEMHRLEEVRDAVIGVVVDEDRPEKRLLGVDVVRRHPVFGRDGFEAGDERVGGGHHGFRVSCARP